MKNTAVLRWVALFVASLTMFGNYYLYDSVAYVVLDLKDTFGFTDQQYGLLYTGYSVAAVGVLFFSGLFVDRFGTKISILLFGVLCSLAGVWAAYSNGFASMFASRLLLGIGAEPLIVAVTVAVAKWFKGKELGFALGVNLLIARLGSVAADWSPSWASNAYEKGWQAPMLIAAGIGALCIIGGALYYLVEAGAEKSGSLNKAGETDKLETKGLFKFSPSFWFVVLLCVTFYSALFPFRGFAPKFFQEAHGITNALAGKLNSWLPTTAMIATPLIGLLIDKVGRRASMMFIGSLILTPVFLMMAYSSISLYVPVAMIGFSFSLIPAVMWPSVAYIVDEKKLGMAYALMALIQQIGVALFAWLIGWANDYTQASAANPQGYNLGMWLFSILGILGLVFSYLLRKAEVGPKGHGLERAKV